MRHAFLSVASLSLVMAIVAVSGQAQISIKIPNIKKVVKQSVDTNADTTVNNPDSSTTRSNNSGSTDWWIDYQIGEINKYKGAVENWDPAAQVFPNPNSNDDYIGLALSRERRSAWLRDKKVSPDPKLDAALDQLKAVLYRRLPEYTINPKSFTNRNAVEEKLMLAEMSDVPGLKVYKIGLNQANWLIDKNELGIPKARYKHGLIYGRDPAAEDPFCRIWYINVVQEYAGGGTYGATEARYIQKEFIACPTAP